MLNVLKGPSTKHDNHTCGRVWRRGGNAALRDGCQVKEAMREESDDSDRTVDQEGKRLEGEVSKGRRDNQKTVMNNIKNARTVSRGLLALCFERRWGNGDNVLH